MASHKIFTPKGFTLVEILVVIGLLVIVGGLSLITSMEDYRGYGFRGERDTLITLLHKARSQAINNICIGACSNGKPHGVHLEPGRYIIFQGSGYAAADHDAAVDETTPARNLTISVTGPDVVFSALAATSTPATLTISDGSGHTSIITIGSEGQILWTN